jgi:hypothetical protein
MNSSLSDTLKFLKKILKLKFIDGISSMKIARAVQG